MRLLPLVTRNLRQASAQAGAPAIWGDPTSGGWNKLCVALSETGAISQEAGACHGRKRDSSIAQADDSAWSQAPAINLWSLQEPKSWPPATVGVSKCGRVGRWEGGMAGRRSPQRSRRTVAPSSALPAVPTCTPPGQRAVPLAVSYEPTACIRPGEKGLC